MQYVSSQFTYRKYCNTYGLSDQPKMEKEEKGEGSEPKEDLKIRERGGWGQSAGWSNLFLSSQTGKLMAGPKFSGYKKAKKNCCNERKLEMSA